MEHKKLENTKETKDDKVNMAVVFLAMCKMWLHRKVLEHANLVYQPCIIFIILLSILHKALQMWVLFFKWKVNNFSET